MGLKDLSLLLVRNLRFLVLGLVLGIVFGILAAVLQRPVYEATTKILVSQTRQQSNADAMPVGIDQLVTTYLQLVKTQPVMDDISSQLGTRIKVDNIQVAPIPNTQIIQIRVQDRDALRSATIANTLFQILVHQNETLQAGRYKSYEDALIVRIDLVQKQISDLQTQVDQINTARILEQSTQADQEIDRLQKEMAGLEKEISAFPLSLTDAQRSELAQKQAQLEQQRSLLTMYQQLKTNLTFLGNPGLGGMPNTNPQLSALQSTLTVYQQLKLSLLNDLESVRLVRTQNTPNVTQIEPAVPPKEPIRPLPLLYLMLGGLVGLILSATAVLMIDHIDGSLATPDQIQGLLGIGVLGNVVDIVGAKDGLVASAEPFCESTQAFRTLGASVGILGAGKSIWSLLVVNAGHKDDKSRIAANLAIVNAQQGKQVILVDGDVRSPHLHHLFGMENQDGLAEIMDDKLDVKRACHPVPGIEGMMLIPGGISEKDSTKWLDAKKIAQLFLDLRKKSDLVILDSPFAETADTQVLASQVDAVLLAINSGRTHINSALDTLRNFRSIGANVLGAVLYRTIQSPIIPKTSLRWPRITLPTKGKKLYADNSEADKVSASAS